MFDFEVFFLALIHVIALFLLWHRKFQKRIRSKLALSAAWVTAIITAPFAYGLIIAACFSVANYYPSTSFDRNEWLTNKKTRYEQSEDIIESRILIGKSKTEVRHLLGDGGTEESPDYWLYYLGYKPSIISIDQDVLDVFFQNGKVIKVTQHQT